MVNDHREKPVSSSRYDRNFFLGSEAGCGCGGWGLIQESGGQQFPRYYDEFYKLAQIEPGDSVLDVGCGRGEFVMYCASRGAVASGVDYSTDAIAIANALQELVAKGRCDSSIAQLSTFYHADSKQLPFPDNHFDVVTSRAVVEHLRQWELLQTLGECRRVLKADGTLVIATHPNVWYRSYGFPIIYGAKRLMPWMREVSGEVEISGNAHAERELGLHVNEQSIISLRRTLKKAGFRSRIWLEPRFAYRRERLAGEFGLAGHVFFLVSHILETWVPFKYVFADEIYAIARKE